MTQLTSFILKAFYRFLLTYACFQCKPCMHTSGWTVLLIWRSQHEVNSYYAVFEKVWNQNRIVLILSSYEIYSNAHAFEHFPLKQYLNTKRMNANGREL